MTKTARTKGDIVYAAEKVTPEAINFMLTHARGLICLALTGERCDKLHLHSQVEHNTAQLGTAFTVTVDAHPKFGVTTGISVHDQAKTIEVAIAEDAQPQDLLRPGHVHPAARPRRRRAGARRADRRQRRSRPPGRPQAGGGHLRNHAATTAKWPAGRTSKNFCARHDLKMCTIADLISYRLKREQFVKRIESITLPTNWGVFRLHAYQSCVDPAAAPGPLQRRRRRARRPTATSDHPRRPRPGPRSQRMPDRRRLRLRPLRLRLRSFPPPCR